MKTIERTDHFTGLNRIVHNHSEKLYKWHLHSYDNDTYGYSCSFPQVWNVDTTSNCSWTAHFLGGKMEISTHLHTNRTNVTHYITSLVSLYHSTTSLIEQTRTTIGQTEATHLQIITPDREDAIFSTHYIVDMHEHVLLISVDIKNPLTMNVTMKDFEHVLRSFHFYP